MEIIGSPPTLTTSCQNYNTFGASSYTNNDKKTTQPVIEAICIIQKTSCELCGRIRHKADTCIIRGTDLIPPSFIRKTKQVNALNIDKTTETPR